MTGCPQARVGEVLSLLGHHDLSLTFTSQRPTSRPGAARRVASRTAMSEYTLSDLARARAGTATGEAALTMNICYESRVVRMRSPLPTALLSHTDHC